MTQILEVKAHELKEIDSIYWSEAHQCIIYAVKNGGNFVMDIDEDGELYYDEAVVTITTEPVKPKSFFSRFFL